MNIKVLNCLIACTIYFSSCNYTKDANSKITTVLQTDTPVKKKKVQISINKRINCFCDRDSLMNEATVSCDTTHFSNQSTIYWQYSCEKIWLTLENKYKEKFVIDTVPVELYGYTFRLGYHLIKEFKSGLLFRSGCPANGPCIYTLIDKYNGKILDQFNQLICIEKFNNASKYEFNFIVYFSANQRHLIINYLDQKKRLKIPFREKITAAVPEQQFNEIILDHDILTLHYSSNNGEPKTLRVDLNDKTYVF